MDKKSQAEKVKILEVIDRHQLRGNIQMLGFQPHEVFFGEAYKHHIFLSPSVTAKVGDSEGGAPITIIEMLATGMPIVSSYHCDIPNIVKHGESGLLSHERDVSEIVSNLEWLIQHPDDWRPMIENGRSTVEKEYDAAIQGVNLSRIYHEIVAG